MNPVAGLSPSHDTVAVRALVVCQEVPRSGERTLAGCRCAWALRVVVSLKAVVEEQLVARVDRAGSGYPELVTVFVVADDDGLSWAVLCGAARVVE